MSIILIGFFFFFLNNFLNVLIYVSKKAHSHKVPPFDVLHHIYKCDCPALYILSLVNFIPEKCMYLLENTEFRANLYWGATQV